LVKVSEEKLAEFGIPVEEMGFLTQQLHAQSADQDGM